MSQRQIVLKVSADGTLVAATRNVVGPSCMDMIDTIKELCGTAELADSRLSSDYDLTIVDRAIETGQVALDEDT
jgi:hypothetical protein